MIQATKRCAVKAEFLEISSFLEAHAVKRSTKLFANDGFQVLATYCEFHNDPLRQRQIGNVQIAQIREHVPQHAGNPNIKSSRRYWIFRQ